jgi:hypothetical protein
MIGVAALGLAAAFLFALSAFLQQRAARTIVGADAASLRDAAGIKRLLGRLVRSRTWLAGLADEPLRGRHPGGGTQGRIGGRGPADDGGTAAICAVTGVRRATPLAVGA